MKRTINIKLSFAVVLNDDRESLPFVRDPIDLILDGVRTMPGLIEIKSGAQLDMSFDRESWNAIHRAARERSKRGSIKRKARAR